MRVIAGTAKKHLLKTPKGLAVRPTADWVKEALFSILGTAVPESRFLDLFAGVGSVGIEALSRGADSAVFVEKEPNNVRYIKENLQITGLAANARCLCLTVHKASVILGKEGQSFDLIFLDPPYLQNLVSTALYGIVENNLLLPGGTIIVESSKKTPPLEHATNMLGIVRQERYGDTLLTFYKYQ